MKKIKIVYPLIFLVMTTSVFAQTYNIATYNIRYNIPENYKFDSTRGEDWQRRGPAIASLIRYHGFDVFGTQEGMPHQLEDILKWAPDYQYIGVGRDDGKQGGEHAAIFYMKDKFGILEHGDFWLSETPDKPSKGWDATCCNRLCSWALLKDLNSEHQFYVFNAHFDHQGIKAREKSAELILQKINEIAGEKPVIFMGDLNGDHGSEWYKALEQSDQLNDTYKMAQDPYALNGSFNGFGRRVEGKSIIDHVFVSKHFLSSKWGILTDTYHGKFPSDHFPVAVTLMIQ